MQQFCLKCLWLFKVYTQTLLLSSDVEVLVGGYHYSAISTHLMANLQAKRLQVMEQQQGKNILLPWVCPKCISPGHGDTCRNRNLSLSRPINTTDYMEDCEMTVAMLCKIDNIYDIFMYLINHFENTVHLCIHTTTPLHLSVWWQLMGLCCDTCFTCKNIPHKVSWHSLQGSHF